MHGYVLVIIVRRDFLAILNYAGCLNVLNYRFLACRIFLYRYRNLNAFDHLLRRR